MGTSDQFLFFLGTPCLVTLILIVGLIYPPILIWRGAKTRIRVVKWWGGVLVVSLICSGLFFLRVHHIADQKRAARLAAQSQCNDCTTVKTALASVENGDEVLLNCMRREGGDNNYIENIQELKCEVEFNRDNKMRSLDGISAFKYLKKLEVYHVGEVYGLMGILSLADLDISAITTLPELESMVIDNAVVPDLSPLTQALHLKTVVIKGYDSNKIDPIVFAQISKLNSLKLEDVSLEGEDSFLKKMNNLENLALIDVFGYTGDLHVSYLLSMKKLKNLWVDGAFIREPRDLSLLGSLESLTFKNCLITGLDGSQTFSTDAFNSATIVEELIKNNREQNKSISE